MHVCVIKTRGRGRGEAGGWPWSRTRRWGLGRGLLILADGPTLPVSRPARSLMGNREVAFPFCPVLLKHLLLKHILPLQRAPWRAQAGCIRAPGPQGGKAALLLGVSSGLARAVNRAGSHVRLRWPERPQRPGLTLASVREGTLTPHVRS